MIIISNINKNIKEFVKTASIYPIINILTIILCISILVMYFRNYVPCNSLIFEDDKCRKYLNNNVKAIQLIKRPITSSVIAPYTDTFSHDMLQLILNNDIRINVSSSRYSSCYISMNTFIPLTHKCGVYIIKDYENTTVEDIIKQFVTHLNYKPYNGLHYNCKDICRLTIKDFCYKSPKESPKGIKFIKQVCNEVI